MPEKQSDFLNEGEGDSKNSVVAELLVQHNAAIVELKRLVAPVNPGASDGVWCLYDDLFFLRYILSFHTAAKAQPAVEETFRYRALPATQTMIRDVKSGEWQKSPIFAKFAKYRVSGLLPDKAQNSGGPVVIARLGMGDHEDFFDNIPLTEQYEANFIFREVTFLQNDTTTRRTGRIAKQVFLIDMTGVIMKNMADPREQKVYSEVSSRAAMWYPQLLDKMCLVNAPSWMNYLFAVVKKVLPKRNTDKFELFSSPEQLWASEWAQRSLNRAFIPVFLGGSMPDEQLPPECTGQLLVPKKADAGWKDITVARRDAFTATLELPMPNIAVKYEVVVAAYGLTTPPR